ncbi:MAG TPA: glycosyltransferase family 2 protein [Oculatellaceae cyanobacterium]
MADRSEATLYPIRTLSVAAPAYNESEGIIAVLLEWVDYLSADSSLDDFEIVICNDGSKDNTGALLEEFAKSHPQLRPVHHKQNVGAAAALATAIENTRFPWVLLTDSDGQYGIDTTPALMRAIESAKARAAIGVRVKKHDSLFARFGSSASGSLCNALHHTHYRDFNCALKLVDGEILRRVNMEARGLNYSAEITSKLIELGVEMEEVEVVHQPRVAGRSSAQNMRAAWHRLLFVAYMGLRQFLLEQKVIQNRIKQ